MSGEASQVQKVKYWTAGYNFWKASQGIEYPSEYAPVQSFEDAPCAGFYRKPIMEKVPDKRAKRVGWEPVAIWFANGTMRALIGNAEDGREVEPLSIWTYICGNPIPESWYREVAEFRRHWPDDHKADTPKVPEDVMLGKQALKILEEAEVSPAERIAAAVKADAALAEGYKGLDSDEAASRAQSLKNALLGHRKAAEDAYNEENRPLLDEQKRLRGIWFPIRDAADAAVKALNGYLGVWEDVKREAARRAQAETDRLAREHAEATRKAEEANKPAPPPPPEVKPNTPAPSAQIRGGAGRAANVKVEKFVTAIDADKVFQQFKGNSEVIELLTKLAEKAVRAGVTVEGAVVEERSVVR